MLLTFSVLSALIIDLLVGEPRRWHPLVGFGNVANGLEKKLNYLQSQPRFLSQLKGLLAWGALILPVVIFLWFIKKEGILGQFEILLDIMCLTLAVGTKSLIQHAKAVTLALNKSDLIFARKKVAMMVSRDMSNSDEKAINNAVIESVLENGNDAVFAAVFWFVIFGAPGVVLYRLANTLDAMWGYRNARFNSFGWAAARIDDALNWLPARLTALSYALAGNFRSSLLCWSQQAKHWSGMNPGVVMSSGAGALKIKLGGAAIYHGVEVKRPELGCNNMPQINDIDRTIYLVYKSLIIWVFVIAIGDYFIV